MKYRISTLFVFLSLCVQLAGQQINGVSLVGPFEDKTTSAVNEIHDLNAGWVSLNPEATLDRKTMELNTELDNKHWSNDLEGYRMIIQEARALGQQVLLKPHVVVDKKIDSDDLVDHEVTWRGDIKPSSYWDWKILDEEYRNYILSMAAFAQAEKIEMFCIGTELKSFVEARPKYWSKLIAEVRNVYSGKLIYSANWDNYEKIPFWEALDYIGVNSYFPISNEAYPTVEVANKNWDSIRNGLKNVSAKNNRQIIITEFGYRNVPYSGKEPWTHNRELNGEVVDEAQTNLLNAFFQSLWSEEWLAGGFLWNWNNVPLSEGNTDFSVQNKPAIELVKMFYSQNL